MESLFAKRMSKWVACTTKCVKKGVVRLMVENFFQRSFVLKNRGWKTINGVNKEGKAKS